MKKRKLLGAVLCSMCLITGSALPAMADSMKVVTLGADLTEEQKNTMMKYFKVNSNEVQIMTITNQDERDHLSSYVPLEQIGTRTVSCAYVKPTQSGGIKVRTANLNWVTCNMIATTLSTSGVKNCEVVAACPFEVSGTGALTGIQMAYETASGEQLDTTKKELATEEMVVTGNLADEVGKNDATTVINQSKMEVIQNNVQNADEIYNIVQNIAVQNNVSVSSEQLDTIVSLLEEIAQQNYNYEDMRETLERVDENVTGNVSENSSPEETPADSIVDNVDDSVLGPDVIESSTEDPTLEQQAEAETPVSGSEGSSEIPEATGDEEYDMPEAVTGEEEPMASYEETDSEPMDASLLSEQAQYQFNRVKTFCEGEYKGDAASLMDTMGEEAYVSVWLDEDTASLLSEKVESIYYDILYNGTDSYVPTETEVYLSTELNMMNAELKKLFGIEVSDVDGTQEDILANVSEEEKQTLYSDTLKFFEKLYGESTESYSETEENTEGTEGETSGEESYNEESYNEETNAEESYNEESYEGDTIPEATGDETYAE